VALFPPLAKLLAKLYSVSNMAYIPLNPEIQYACVGFKLSEQHTPPQQLLTEQAQSEPIQQPHPSNRHPSEDTFEFTT